MKKHLIATVIVPVFIAVIIQTYMLFRLTDQIIQLNAKISTTGNQLLEESHTLILTPISPSNEIDSFEGQRESY